MKTFFTVFFCGLLFGIGLGISGMMNPVKVQGFLDLSGQWDPSLILVMGGAVAVTFLVFPLILKRSQPLQAEQFYLLTSTAIEKKLLIGGALFGAGWAISGFCPGPAIASVFSGNIGVGVFLISMFTGFAFHRFLLEPKGL